MTPLKHSVLYCICGPVVPAQLLRWKVVLLRALVALLVFLSSVWSSFFSEFIYHSVLLTPLIVSNLTVIFRKNGR